MRPSLRPLSAFLIELLHSNGQGQPPGLNRDKTTAEMLNFKSLWCLAGVNGILDTSRGRQGWAGLRFMSLVILFRLGEEEELLSGILKGKRPYAYMYSTSF
ncbi:hypothetical protein BD289DRAFT_75060 [Coniella lustricola]|uniref:Uncharacterized protein n=1 Tax=Coniella lustricola TaxID=2025994 RepID=A0A2T3AHP9_9PEZI|nr:hypothetical protein BD289DRAFT_75060 [Coniella lustricola]